jgi:predicted CXXCH cytochrome family protein
MRFLKLATYLICFLLLPQDKPGYVGKGEKLPWDPGPQPVAFGHRAHTEAGLKCSDCHGTVETEDQAGMPSTGKCMACHRVTKTESEEVKKLAGYHARKEKIPWVRVYTVPDIVFFSHANHLRAQVKCEDCHGDAGSSERLMKVKATNMASCMTCHAQRQASTDCSLCHQLGQ